MHEINRPLTGEEELRLKFKREYHMELPYPDPWRYAGVRLLVPPTLGYIWGTMFNYLRHFGTVVDSLTVGLMVIYGIAVFTFIMNFKLENDRHTSIIPKVANYFNRLWRSP